MKILARGIDISSHQNPAVINYDELAKNIDFAILRASYTGWGGKGDLVYKDTAFNTHYDELTSRGIPVGAYHYGCADTLHEAINEADFFLNVVKGKMFAYPVYYDTEDQYHQAKLTPNQLTDVVTAFVKKVEAEGYFTGIYASHSWFYNNLNLDRLTKIHKWVAHWSAQQHPMPQATLWQTSSTGRVSGYTGPLDLTVHLVKHLDLLLKNHLTLHLS